jgi:hypothetical protein
MYLPSETVRELLEANGYASPEVYSSAVEGKTKHSGALFEEVLRKLGCAAERVVHVGDHPESDHRRPNGMGIRTLHVVPGEYGATALADRYAPHTGAGRVEVLSSVFTGLARRRSLLAGGSGDLWDRLGYEVAGPLAAGFVRWIAQRAKADGVERLFFLSRDGYLLEKAFRAVCGRWNLSIESTYTYSSRRLLNMARIERLDEEAFHFLLTSDPLLRVRDFLSRAGLDAGALAEDVARLGLGGLDEVLTNGDGYFLDPRRRDAMRRLLLGQEEVLLARAAEERKRLLAYFGDVGFAPGPMAIVDLGWQASSIRSLQDLLRRSDPAFRLRGYYFGTWRAAAPAIEAGCLVESFLFHLGLPESRAGLAAECVELLEHLFTAPHPTVVGLDRRDGRWEPVCGEWETTADQRGCLARVAKGALAFVEDFLAFEDAPSVHASPYGYLESVLERVLRHPTLAEARTLGALPHRASFGGSAPWRPLAQVAPTLQAAFRPSAIQAAYDRAYWKHGLMAQMGPAERALVKPR